MLGNNDYGQEKLLNDILRDATVLEHLYVSIIKYDEEYERKQYQLWNEYKFCKELYMLSRSSLGCQIEFSGNMITASSNDLSNGELHCQIVE